MTSLRIEEIEQVQYLYDREGRMKRKRKKKKKGVDGIKWKYSLGSGKGRRGNVDDTHWSM